MDIFVDAEIPPFKWNDLERIKKDNPVLAPLVNEVTDFVRSSNSDNTINMIIISGNS